MSILSKPYFHDEEAAHEKLESILWPHGPVCPHCGAADKIYAIKGKSARIGLKKCGHCRKQFTVKVKTVFESSHVPLHKWLQAAYLLASSKKGISANQLARTLEVTVKTGWFMAHRLREAMRSGSIAPLGGKGGIVEVDETYFSRKKGEHVRRGGYAHKMAVLTLVDRKGEARSFRLEEATKSNIIPTIKANIARETTIASDNASYYRDLKADFAGHETVNHYEEEWVRGEIHTNRAEGYFSLFKRGMRGVYQHCSEKHQHRYLSEYDFRYNNRVALGVHDEQRANFALSGITGKRLKYRDS